MKNKFGQVGTGGKTGESREFSISSRLIKVFARMTKKGSFVSLNEETCGCETETRDSKIFIAHSTRYVCEAYVCVWIAMVKFTSAKCNYNMY